jgi:hypothetical protein
MPSRLVLRYSNTCSGSYVQTVVCSGNESNQTERQETEWRLESVTGSDKAGHERYRRNCYTAVLERRQSDTALYDSCIRLQNMQ